MNEQKKAQHTDFVRTAYGLMQQYAKMAWTDDTAAAETMAQTLAAVTSALALDSIASTQIGQTRAAQRMAEAAERANDIAEAQRLDQERQAAQIFGVLARIAAAVEYMATGVAYTPPPSELPVSNVDPFGMDDDDDQRAEDNAGYNAGIAESVLDQRFKDAGL